MKNYPEIGITIQGSPHDVEQGRRWLESLAERKEIEIVREGRRWTVGGRKYGHVVIRLISGQLNLLQSHPAPNNHSAVLGSGRRDGQGN